MDTSNMADVQETIEIAKSVLHQCMVEEKKMKEGKEKISKKLPLGAMTAFEQYTGRKVVPDPHTKPVSFKELMKRRDLHKTITTDKTSKEFRDALVDFYLNKRRIPTLEDINNVKVEKGMFFDPATGFILEPLPGMSKGIIIEDPKRTFRRTVYLKKMEQLRKENTHIVYAKHNVRLYRLSRQVENKMFIAVSPQVGLLHLIFFFCTKDTNATMKWLIDCAKLEGHFVLVLEEEDDKETPKFSNKLEMSNWLTANGVIHDDKAHRGELSDLINKQSLELQLAKSKMDEFISSIRCEVVRYPKGTEELNFFNSIQRTFILEKYLDHSHSSKGKTIKDELEGLSLEAWQSYEKALVETEARMLKEDMMMEEVIDSLKTMAADGVLPDSAEGLTDAFNWETIAAEIIID